MDVRRFRERNRARSRAIKRMVRARQFIPGVPDIYTAAGGLLLLALVNQYLRNREQYERI